MKLLTHRFIEFFEGDSRLLSMHRLGFFVALIVTSGIMLWLTYFDRITENYLEWYVTVFAIQHLAGKAIDSRTFGNKAPVEPGEAAQKPAE